MYWSNSAIHGSPGDSVLESLSPPESELASHKGPWFFVALQGTLSKPGKPGTWKRQSCPLEVVHNVSRTLSILVRLSALCTFACKHVPLLDRALRLLLEVVYPSASQSGQPSVPGVIMPRKLSLGGQIK